MKCDIQFLDIGVFKGSKIDCILNINPYSKIIGIEPFKKYFLDLKKKYKNNKNINILNYAISDKEGLKNFYYNSKEIDKESFSLKKNIKLNKIKKIYTKKIVDILKNKTASIIKIDTEGSEYDILKNSKNILSKKKIVFFIETTHLTFKKIKKLLKIYNYKVYVYEFHLFKKKLKNNWKDGNVIKNDEFTPIIYTAKAFDNCKNEFMFNIVAVPEKKKTFLKKFIILDKIT